MDTDAASTAPPLIIVVYSCWKRIFQARLLHSMIRECVHPSSSLPTTHLYVCVGKRPPGGVDYGSAVAVQHAASAESTLRTLGALVELECGDAYEHLAEKTRALLAEIIRRHPGARGLVKCDDDVLPVPEHLRAFLRHTEHAEYTGTRVRCTVPRQTTDHCGKCSAGKFNRPIAVPACTYVAGPMYYLSAAAIRRALAPGRYRPAFFFEDVAVGIALRPDAGDDPGTSASSIARFEPVHFPATTDNVVTFTKLPETSMHNIAGRCRVVYTLLNGGLGNQLFQVAAAYGLAARHRCFPVVVYARNAANMYVHNTEREFLDTIFRKCTVLEYSKDLERSCVVYSEMEIADGPPPISQQTQTGARFQWTLQPKKTARTSSVAPPDPFGYNADIVADPQRSYLLHGYFQNWRYFSAGPTGSVDVVSELCALFANPEICARLRARFPALDRGAFFVHVRRGDYLLHPEYQVVPESYYAASVRRFDPARDHMMVVSNDPAFCRTFAPVTDGWPESARTLVGPEDLTTLETLYLMALCRRGGVCANSTFSWWGAFLGLHGGWNDGWNNGWNNDDRAAGRQIFLPERWMAGRKTDLQAAFGEPVGVV